jgi:hypothetical protein
VADCEECHAAKDDTEEKPSERDLLSVRDEKEKEADSKNGDEKFKSEEIGMHDPAFREKYNGLILDYLMPVFPEDEEREKEPPYEERVDARRADTGGESDAEHFKLCAAGNTFILTRGVRFFLYVDTFDADEFLKEYQCHEQRPENK